MQLDVLCEGCWVDGLHTGQLGIQNSLHFRDPYARSMQTQCELYGARVKFQVPGGGKLLNNAIEPLQTECGL